MDTAMLSFFLGDTEEVIHFLLTTSVMLPMFSFKLLRDADLLSFFFFFGGKHKLTTFLRFLFRKQNFQCCQQKKQATLVVDVAFFCLCQSLLFKEEFSPAKGKQRENGCVLQSLYLFSSLAFFFFFEEEKKKLYRKIKEKKTLYRYPKNCLLVRCVSLLIQQTHKQKKPFF